eukprot:TRINITY_DN14031_c0_g1_i1.p1 TRINITY_DN14031_c0_g1~~TRINITY_DN14031_c0_g1_i1.p1  ORF type:complete len:734 (+),score=92.30 TRINITY_DN14031_c0_g1_i1:52-2253(+)
MSEWRKRHSLLKKWSSWIISEETDKVSAYYLSGLSKLFDVSNRTANDDRVLGTFGIVTYRLLKGRADQKETQGTMNRIGLFYGSLCQVLVSLAMLGCGSITFLSSVAGILTAILGIVTAISSGRSYYRVFLMINLSFPPLLVAHVYRNYYHNRIVFNECFPVFVDYTIDSVACSSSESTDKVALLLTCLLLAFTLMCTRCCAEYLNSSTLLNNYSSHGLLFIYLRGVAGRLRVGVTDAMKKQSDSSQQLSGSDTETDPMTLMERFCGWFPMKEEHTENSVTNNGLMELFENRITGTPSSSAKSGLSSPTSPLFGGPRHDSMESMIQLECMVNGIIQDSTIKQPPSMQVHVPVPQRQSQFGKVKSSGSLGSSTSLSNTFIRERKDESEFMSISHYDMAHREPTAWKELRKVESCGDTTDTRTTPTPPAGSDGKTTEATRRKRRAYQVALGKKTQEYINYINAVPLEDRGPNDPVTPPVSPPQSRRAFYKLACEWRQQLHRWDTEGYVDPQSKSAKTVKVVKPVKAVKAVKAVKTPKKKAKAPLPPPPTSFGKIPTDSTFVGRVPAINSNSNNVIRSVVADPSALQTRKASQKRVCWAPSAPQTQSIPVPVSSFSNYCSPSVAPDPQRGSVELLSVTVLTTHSHCTGIYEIQSFPVNGFPMWKALSHSGYRFLYSGEGRWVVSDSMNDFSTSSGFIRSYPHGGKFNPNKMRSWQSGDGSTWRDDSGIMVKALYGD